MSKREDVRKKAFFDYLYLGDIEGASLCALGHECEYMTAHKPKGGQTTLQEVILGGLAVVTDGRSADNFLKVAVWLLDHGADPHQLATASAEVDEPYEYYIKDKPEQILYVNWVDESTSSLIAAILNAIDELESVEDWADARKWLASFLPILKKAAVASARSDDHVALASFVQDSWYKVLADKETHDLVLQCVDGSVSAHSCVLCQTSCVLRAMLKTRMLEAESRQIQVDCPCAAATTFLELVYMGGTLRKYSIATGLPALDLAHRWQVKGVVYLLERAACRALTKETFGAIAEAAVLKGLVALRSECEWFAREHELHKSEKEFLGSLPEVVVRWLGEVLPQGPSPSRKRIFSLISESADLPL
mmetsp:Transcript_41641/g.75569  ORF Transcript_41641/g.75569 Transcript_41641/m.75569 type:complete len:363 (-) Transcript_41641:72-1160(-)